MIPRQKLCVEQISRTTVVQSKRHAPIGKTRHNADNARVSSKLLEHGSMATTEQEACIPRGMVSKRPSGLVAFFFPTITTLVPTLRRSRPARGKAVSNKASLLFIVLVIK